MVQEASFLLHDQVFIKACYFEHIAEHLFGHICANSILGFLLLFFLTISLTIILVYTECKVENLAFDSRLLLLTEAQDEPAQSFFGENREVGHLLWQKMYHHRFGVWVASLLETFSAVHDDNFPSSLHLQLLLGILVLIPIVIFETALIYDALQSDNGFIDDRVILSFKQVCESIYNLCHDTICSRLT